MLKYFLPVILLILLLTPFSQALAAETDNGVPRTMRLTIINHTDFAISHKGVFAAKGQTAIVTLPRFNKEDETSLIFLEVRCNVESEVTNHIVLFLVRMPEAIWQKVAAGHDLKAEFYLENGTAYARVSVAGDDSLAATYLYHPVLEEWALLETEYGVLVYQDNALGWDEWVQSGKDPKLFRTPWEHLYPGKMDDWLRSPMESRGFIVPITEIYNVGTWSHDEMGSFKLERLTADIPKITNEQLVVVKTFGDFGWGMLSYQTADKKWHFIEYGYDGWGGFGGLWYYIINDTPSDYIKYNPKDVPWPGQP